MKYTKEILEKAVSESYSVSDVVRKFYARTTGSRNRHIAKRIKDFNIDTSHFKTIYRDKFCDKLHYEEILVLNRCNRRELSSRLRRALIESGIEEKCSECGLGKVWNNKKLRIQIDHINGDGYDNRKENLRFLCPNCHSQTENYGYNKIIKKVKPKKTKKYTKYSRTTKRPAKEVLEKLVWEKPSILIAKDFGVSDSIICRWCKHYGLTKPPRGYWAKKKYGSVV